MSQTLDKPRVTLRPAAAAIRPHDHLLVPLEVLTATAGAWLVRLPGGAKKCWLAYSICKEVPPDRPIPDGSRMFSVPAWKQRMLARDLSD